MKTWLSTAAMAVLAFVTFSAVRAAGESAFNMNVTVQDITLGKQVLGPAVSAGDLANRVVLLEFWGVKCPPCIASLPHLAEWQKQYENQGLLIVAAEAQGHSDQQITDLITSKGATNLAVLSSARVKGGDDFSGIPHCMLFDHTGKCIYRGSPFEVESKLKAALAAAPAAALAGRDLQKLGSLANALKAGEPAGSVIKKAQAQLSSKDAATADEAKWIVDTLTAWGNKQVESAKAARDSDPSGAWAALQKASAGFKGTDVGQSADALLAEWKKDKPFMDEVNAGTMLAQLRTLEGKLQGVGTMDPASAGFQARNKAVLGQLAGGIAAFRQKYAATKSAAAVDALAKKYGLN